jgi:hypothetical protein
MALGIVLAGVLAEVGYRIYLYTVGAPDRFARKPPQVLAVHDRPMWIYDEQFGYVYPKGERIHVSGISSGRVTDCGYIDNFNGDGNVGKSVGDYGAADVRILIFGDSFTATAHDGITWPLLLQERLARRLGRRVQAVNFGRDGYGILQMFDLAAAKIPEWKPHLAIFAFISQDLNRRRFWRAVTRVKGRWRHLVSPEPTPNPDPEKSYDTALYHPEATPLWCQSLKGTGQRDGVLEDIEQAYREGIALGERRRPTILTARHSYLFARLLRGDPFHRAQRVFAFPGLPYRSYADDARFRENLGAIQTTGVPYVLVHLAEYRELKAGREYILTRQEARLLESLVEVTGKPVWETTRFIRLPVDQPEHLRKSPDDHHPSLAGLQMYAEAVAEMLVRSGVVQ